MIEKMKKEIVINATGKEIRVALLEENRLVEIFIETPETENPVGAIYLGKVKRVAQGMNAAFVDIGDSQDAFLHFSDAANASELDTGDDDDDELPTPKIGNKSNINPNNKKENPHKEEISIDPNSEKLKNNNKSNSNKNKKKSKVKSSSNPKVELKESLTEEKRAIILTRPKVSHTQGNIISKLDLLTKVNDLKIKNEVNFTKESQVKLHKNKLNKIDYIKQVNPKSTDLDLVSKGLHKGNKKLVLKKGLNNNSLNQKQNSRELIASNKVTQVKVNSNLIVKQQKSNNLSQKNSEIQPSNSFNDGNKNDVISKEKKLISKKQNNDISSNIKSVLTSKKQTKVTEGKQDNIKTKQSISVNDNKSKSIETVLSISNVVHEKNKIEPNKKIKDSTKISDKNRSINNSVSKKRNDNIIKLENNNPILKNNSNTLVKEIDELKSDKKNELKKKVKSIKSKTIDNKLPTFQTKRSGSVIIDLVKGQEILVQVTRERYAQKGMRVSTKISLPGRFLVLLPLEPMVGVSKKIESYIERKRLRRIAKEMLPTGYGCIIRTVAKEKDEDIIREELSHLIARWKVIDEKIKVANNPSLIYSESSLVSSIMRDLFTENINKVIIDDKKVFEEIREYVSWAAPDMLKNIEHYKEKNPIYESFGIEKELAKMFHRKIYLKSGGYIILEQTEAMMVVDVNSGRYKGSNEQEINALHTNIESAREIARQLKLRDVGGLVAIDFIDMQDDRNKRKIYDEMRRLLLTDKAKTVVLPMSQFCILQITRQRIRNQVVNSMSETCRTCDGRGFVHSKPLIMKRIEQWLHDFKQNTKDFRLSLSVNPSMMDYITEGNISRLTKLMMKNFVRIKLIPDETLPIENFRFFSHRLGLDVTDKLQISNT